MMANTPDGVTALTLAAVGRDFMATHASSDLRRALGSRQSAPRVTYNVRSTCLGTAASIVALLALFVVLVLI